MIISSFLSSLILATSVLGSFSLPLFEKFSLAWKNSDKKTPAELSSSLPQRDHNESLLTKISQEESRLIKEVFDSVVSITDLKEKKYEELLEEFFHTPTGTLSTTTNLGSGIILSDQGYLITCFHVVKEGIKLTVTLHDGRIFPAKLIASDPETDIAILKIQAPLLKPLRLGNSDEVNVGERIFSFGNPFGLQETVSQGIISAKGAGPLSEQHHQFFQTTAFFYPGYSGGPVINTRGEVIGVNQFIFHGEPSAPQINFITPINLVRHIYNSLVRDGRVAHPWLGILIKQATPAGVEVLSVTPDSPAQQAGILPKDAIVSLNQTPLSTLSDFYNSLALAPINKEIEATLLREGKLLKIKMTLIEEKRKR